MVKLTKAFSSAALSLLFTGGVSLLALNLFGLTQEIRVSPVPNQDLRFPNDQAKDFASIYPQLEKKLGEADLDYAQRINILVSKGLAHINWHWLPPDEYNMRVPLWDNYFLSLLGHVSNIPEYRRYHFIDPIRSLKRGIGICGDASMILSQLLDKASIENEIISFTGHVVVAIHIDGKERILDPDYGIDLEASLETMQAMGDKVGQLYAKNFSTREVEIMGRTLNSPYKRWQNTKSFVTKKYYFEHVTYTLKWPLPLAMIIGSIVIARRQFKKELQTD